MSDDLVENPSLVGRSFFVSPVYQKGRNLDKVDNFVSWLRANSLGPFRHFGSDHNMKEYLFQGRAGTVLCQIASEVFEEEGARLICLGDNFEGPYRRVVLVRRMPAERAVPIELENEFDRRGYVVGSEEEHGMILRMVGERRTFRCEL